jgi:hypothetical protein
MTDVFPFSGLERRLTGMGVLRGSLTGDDYHHHPGDDHFHLFFREDDECMKIAFYRFRFAGFPCRGIVFRL